MQGGDDWPLAEIISIKEIRGQRGYYVHYVDCKYNGPQEVTIQKMCKIPCQYQSK